MKGEVEHGRPAGNSVESSSQRSLSRQKAGQSAAEVIRALEVHPSVLHRWRWELRGFKARSARRPGQQAGGRSGTMRSIIHAGLSACRAAAGAAGATTARLYGQAEEEFKNGTRLTVIEMSEVVGFSLAGYYCRCRCRCDSVLDRAAGARTWTCAMTCRRSPWSGPTMEGGGIGEK